MRVPQRAPTPAPARLFLLLPLRALLRLLPPTLCCLFPAVLQRDGLDISWRLLLCWAARAFLSVHLLLLLHAMSARPVPLRLLPPSGFE